MFSDRLSPICRGAIAKLAVAILAPRPAHATEHREAVVETRGKAIYESVENILIWTKWQEANGDGAHLKMGL